MDSPPLDRRVRPDFDPGRFGLIDRLCDRFEADWRAGAGPRIESVLASAPAALRDDLFAPLLAVELELRGEDGPAPTREEYRARFPGRDREIDRAFSGSHPAPPRAAEPPDLPDADGTPARRRSRFRILRLLCRGGAGDLYVAHDAQLDREVALKQLRAEVSGWSDARRRLEREALVTGALEHPGVVPVHVAGRRANGEPYFVMRLIRGRTLKEEFEAFHATRPWRLADRRRRLPLRRLMEHLLDVGNTLAYAHSRGITHRDLKPSNIMLGDYGETLVVDWGLAKCRGVGDDPGILASPPLPGPDGAPTDTLPGSLMGTPGYLSPEQADGQVESIGPASDIYGMGATLFHLLTGRPPFDPRRPLPDLLDDVRAGRHPRPRDLRPAIPKDLEAICLKAMAVRPEDRYGSAGELVQDLERWLADEPVGARREGWPSRASRWARRHRTTTVAGSILLFAAGLLAATAWQRTLDERELAAGRVSALRTAQITAVPELIKVLAREPGPTIPMLRAALRQARSPDERLRLELGLIPSDPGRVDSVLDALGESRPETLLVLRDQLSPHRERIAPRLWRLLDDPTQPPRRRFQAACVLAHGAADDPRWERHSGFLYEQLGAEMTQDPRGIGAFADLFRPIRRALLPELIRTYRARPPFATASEAPRKLALGLLLDHFGQDADVLADVIPDAPDDDFPRLLERIRTDPSRAIPVLLRAISEPPDAWPEPDEAAAASPPTPDLAARVTEARGLVDTHYALCQTMLLDAFLRLAEALRPAHYRPIRVRPYRDADGLTTRVAAVWTRDRLPWSLTSEPSVAAVQERVRTALALGQEPRDLAGYLVRDGRTAELAYLVLTAGRAFGSDSYLRARRKLASPQRESLLCWTEPAPFSAIEIGPRSPRPDGVPTTQQIAPGADGGPVFCRILTRLGDEARPLDPLVGDRDAFLDGFAHGGTSCDIAIGPGPAHARLFSALWDTDRSLQSALALGADPAAHLDRCRELARRGYRPLGIAVVPADARAAIAAASVWQRPRLRELPDGQPDRRIAQAAATLLRLGEAEPAWPLFHLAGDPGVRAYLVERLRPLDVDAGLLADRYRVETDVSARRTLIQALGTYPSTALPAEFLALARTHYEREPDPGLHSSLGWLLSTWGQAARPDRATPSPRGPQPAPGPSWSVNSQGLTLATIPGPVEFTMGRPAWYRAEDQQAHPHRVRIERSFAIGTHEVTVAQFERFLAEHPEARAGLRNQTYRTFSPGPDCPMTALDWFQAARFCRWLDEKEGTPEDQRPYPPIAEIREGMTLPSDYLRRTGYRLPTEAEWEYACRAGAASPEPYGRWDGDRPSPALLPRFAWCLVNSDNRTHPVGTRLPNDFGLFDVLGNVHEWCHDRKRPYCRGRCHEVRPDREDPEAIEGRTNRVLRGSWFAYPLAGVRTAQRSWNWPIYPSAENGFRVARTVPPSSRPPADPDHPRQGRDGPGPATHSPAR